jgi:hypothetical protein
LSRQGNLFGEAKARAKARRELGQAGLIVFALLSSASHAQVVVWTENGSIYRANADGSNKRRIFEASATAGAATGLAYDPATRKLYWDGRSNPLSQTDGHGIVRRSLPAAAEALEQFISL